MKYNKHTSLIFIAYTSHLYIEYNKHTSEFQDQSSFKSNPQKNLTKLYRVTL